MDPRLRGLSSAGFWRHSQLSPIRKTMELYQARLMLVVGLVGAAQFVERNLVQLGIQEGGQLEVSVFFARRAREK
jgi:hypothetical protein